MDASQDVHTDEAVILRDSSGSRSATLRHPTETLKQRSRLHSPCAGTVKHLVAANRHDVLRNNAADGVIPAPFDFVNTDLGDNGIHRSIGGPPGFLCQLGMRLLEDEDLFFAHAQKRVTDRNAGLSPQLGIEQDVLLRLPARLIEESMCRRYTPRTYEYVVAV